MRIGIYTGRILDWAEAQGVLVRASIVLLTEFLARQSAEDELVFYCDPTSITEEMWSEIDSLPTLFHEQRELALLAAGRFFRPLPNGARCRVLFRRLPQTRLGPPGSKLASSFYRKLDCLLLAFYARVDGLNLLHVLGPVDQITITPTVRCPLVATVTSAADVQAYRRVNRFLTFSKQTAAALATEHGVPSSSVLLLNPAESNGAGRYTRSMREAVLRSLNVCQQLILSSKGG